MVPTVGSMNLVKHLVKKDKPQPKGEITEFIQAMRRHASCYMSPIARKPVSWVFTTRSDINQTVQRQKMVRSLSPPPLVAC